MNSYDLSRSWFDWCFENPEKINPNHTALFFFCVEHCNRLGWKEKFGLPTSMAKEAIGIRSYTTYKKTLDDLVLFGFIKIIEVSKNQYSSNIIALIENNKALDKADSKALDKALQKHLIKQVESTQQSNSSINKQETIEQLNKEQITINLKKESKQKVLKNKYGEFENVLLSDEEYLKAQEKYGEHLGNMIEKLSSYIKSKGDKYRDHYATFSSWVYKSVLEDRAKDENSKNQSKNRNSSQWQESGTTNVSGKSSKQSSFFTGAEFSAEVQKRMQAEGFEY